MIEEAGKGNVCIERGEGKVKRKLRSKIIEGENKGDLIGQDKKTETSLEIGLESVSFRSSLTLNELYSNRAL